MAQLTTEQYLGNIQNGLLAELTKHKEALPPGFNRERFILNETVSIPQLSWGNNRCKWR